jgi:hypothetical protein
MLAGVVAVAAAPGPGLGRVEPELVVLAWAAGDTDQLDAQFGYSRAR